MIQEIINKATEAMNVTNVTGLGAAVYLLNIIYKFLDPFFHPILSKTGEAVGERLSEKIKRKAKKKK